jgi:6-pyruvoyltetrahydropterin/6-carboxytetrahydropterin synthase
MARSSRAMTRGGRKGRAMFTVGVRDHVMIAHSFRGEVFGPAQRLHGATYVVDLEFRCEGINDDGIVVDIGRAQDELKSTLAELSYQNLDDLPVFEGRNTTTEFLARHVFDRVRDAIQAGRLGPGGENVTGLKVTLHESHVAWAAYEGRV